jgi:hypothetical protein
MSILGRLLRSLFAPPRPAAQPAHAQTVQRIGKLELGLVERANLQLQMLVARELRDLLADPRYAAPGRLERHGRKVWSQNDEDGIIEEIFRRVGIASHSFVEFGVGGERECNTLKLLVEGWRGLWMESSAPDCELISRVFAARLATGQLELLQTRVSAENIDGLIAGARVAAAGELDLLSIDIDGNDYHVLKSIRRVRPRVLVIEYNGKYPPPMDVVPPYDPSHEWDGSDYAGSSLQAIANLATRLGYRLVGTNITGLNAFFVRADIAADHFADGDAATLYNPARYYLSVGYYVAGHVTGKRFDYTSDAALESKNTKL